MRNSQWWKSLGARHDLTSLGNVLYITLGVFLTVFALAHVGSALYASSLAESATQEFAAGLASEKARLRAEGNAVAADPRLHTLLEARDGVEMLNFLRAQSDHRHVPLLSVADAQGVIVGRTFKGSRPGQNVFLTAPVGRAVSQGRSVESVEMTGFGEQIFVTTGRPVEKDGQAIGALFANALLDDDYATQFRARYLPKGAEVAFYSKEFGVYSNSIIEPQKHKIIHSYFNPGSDWIEHGVSGRTVAFLDGSLYLVENIPFEGLEGPVGGALVFVPRRDIAPLVQWLMALVSVSTFLVLAHKHYRRAHPEHTRWHYIAALGSVGLLLAVLLFFVAKLEQLQYARLGHIPYALYNSTLRLQPEYGVYDLGFPQRLAIVVDTGDEAINMVQVGLTFDSDAVRVLDVEPNPETCSYVIERHIDQDAGSARVVCALFKTGGDRGSLVIGNVVVEPKRAGDFTIAFDATYTQVLASDGLGTNVLRAAQSGSYRTVSFESHASSTGEEQPLMVFSPSHPNQIRWYKDAQARFVWRGVPGALYAYELNTTPDGVPSRLKTTQDTHVTVPVPGDGIYYFHLQSLAGGPVAHHMVRVDRTPPTITSMRLSSNRVVVGDVVRLLFDAEDTGGGMQQNYYVDAGNHLFLPIGSQLYIPFIEAGVRAVTLRVYDNAGNYAQKTTVVEVEAP